MQQGVWNPLCTKYNVSGRFVGVILFPLCAARVSRVCPVCVPAPTGVFLPVQTHRGESGPVRACVLSAVEIWSEPGHTP